VGNTVAEVPGVGHGIKKHWGYYFEIFVMGEKFRQLGPTLGPGIANIYIF